MNNGKRSSYDDTTFTTTPPTNENAPHDNCDIEGIRKAEASESLYEAVLNEGTENEVAITGYLLSRKWYNFQWFLTALSLGLLQLVFFWRRDWQLRFTHINCMLREADHILAKANDDRISASVCKVYWLDTATGMQHRKRPAESTHKNGKGVTNSAASFDNIAEGENGQSGGFAAAHYVRFFTYQKLRYIWDDDRGKFTMLQPEPLAKNTPCSYFYDLLSANGYTDRVAQQRRNLYGENSISIRVTPVIELLMREILGPFYVFQIFAIILWFCTQYYYYAACIVLMSALSAGLAVYVTRKSQRTLQRTVHAFNQVNVVREGKVKDITSDQLVPGDLIEIPASNWVMNCDAVLVSGVCIMGEAMLTGESMPVTKTTLPNQADKTFSIVEHGRHTLSGGTLVIQSKKLGGEPVRAIVLRTGWMTRKGDLVRSILFPKPFGFHFNRHSYYFILCLGGLGIITFIYTCVVYSMLGQSVNLILNKGLSLITIIVPPALPAAMTIALVTAQQRLKKKGIFSISQKYILVCGAIDAVCFDKTGTLTEDGLDIWGVIPSSDSNFDHVITDMAGLPQKGPLASCLAACHSLTYIDGKLLGDPLELKMFEATRWTFEEIENDDDRSKLCNAIARPPQSTFRGDAANVQDSDIGIVRMFTFESSLQRMSVIGIHLSSKSLVAFAKGSPEMICKLCVPSTIPRNFEQQLNHYAKQGYRIIGIAWKRLPSDMTVDDARSSTVTRDSIECDLDFLGLLIMENRLKDATTHTLQELRNANIKTIMVTGDNILTAVSVSRKCCLIGQDEPTIVVRAEEPTDANHANQKATLKYFYADSDEAIEGATDANDVEKEVQTPPPNYRFAMNGTTWGVLRKYYADIIPQLVTRGAVFARMAPEQKAQLVEALQDVNYYVAMCGDGANDCGALKAAHTGCSLSEAEASVASPFTSNVQDISCIPKLIKEGRCTLVGSFGVFKLMLLYSFCQLTAACYVYWAAQDLGPQQYLWQDLFEGTTLVITFCWSGPSNALSEIRPPTSLIGFKTLFEMAVHIIFIAFFQGVAYIWTSWQPWAFPPNVSIDMTISATNRAVFQVACFQIVGFAIVVAHSHPYRKSIFTNYLFLSDILLLTIGNTLIFMLINFDPTVLTLYNIPSYLFRFDLILVALLNFFVSYIFEQFFMESKAVHNCIKAVETRKYSSKPRFLTKHAKIDDQLSKSQNLPRPKIVDTGVIVRLQIEDGEEC